MKTIAFKIICSSIMCTSFLFNTYAQQAPAGPPPFAGGPGAAPGGAKHEDTEVYSPVPKKVTPAASTIWPPSDAIVLLSDTKLDQWIVANQTKAPVTWTVENGEIKVAGTVRGNIETTQSFKNYQLHLEFRIPEGVTGTGQNRGNGGIFLASTGPGDAGYEMQILDSYENETYTNGMGASIYKQFIPAANASKPAGQWQSFDIAWLAPTFNADGSVKTPARATVFQNGILVHNNVELKGETIYVGQPAYKKYDKAPIKIQNRAGLGFRNIWIREIDDVSYTLPAK